MLDHERRRIIHFNITTNPTAAWVAQQIRDAFPWDSVPRYLIHDQDPVFLGRCQDTLKAMGIKEVKIAPASPWQNAYCERVIGSIRKECLDHVIVMNQRTPETDADLVPDLLLRNAHFISVWPKTALSHGRCSQWALVKSSPSRISVVCTISTCGKLLDPTPVSICQRTSQKVMLR